MSYQYRSDLKTNAPHAVSVPSFLPKGGFYRTFGKRVLDTLIVLAASVPLLLVVGLLAMFVRRDGGPAFYTQKRIGKDGREFGILKLRTMVPNADAVMEEYLANDPAARAEWDHHQKLRNDPRITAAGRLLRRTSLDELPQLWNVLVGDMSIVGPRPMMLEQRVLYPGTEYYEMRPGITGFWQVSDRHETGFHERAGYDRDYFHQMSFGTDLKTLWQTVAVVLGAKGC